ncbi:anti sigma factor C-terminal domain-containing protein [Psychrobacillus sp. FSL H8-0483]|uniref:anti-sigma factor n=1 Tax=Psychrobacillus sp. FSL H8-0483 TaxID=2921389 RepID=UPI0031599C21
MSPKDKAYENLINGAKKEIDVQNFHISEEQQQKIMKWGKMRAKWTTVVTILAILLLILPVLTLFSFGYYAIGGRANELIEVADKTIYLTEPNVSVAEREVETTMGIFSMDVHLNLEKKVGKDTIRFGEFSVPFLFNNAEQPVSEYRVDSPPKKIPYFNDELIHPKAPLPYAEGDEWEKLQGLPEGTVAEAYISFDKEYLVEEIEQLFAGKEMELRWYAVYTGNEDIQMADNGVYVSPIGFPAQIDPDQWSPFNGEESNEKVFLDSMKYLQKHEDVATMVARSKELDLTKRVQYVEQNGIKIYGAVVTGPTKEIMKLQEESFVRGMKRGEVRLWNWNS